MYFSVETSIGTGVIPSAFGIGVVNMVTLALKLLIASIPFLFSIQQYTEAFLRISIPNKDSLIFSNGSTYAYLSFAQILWTIGVPLAILLLEPHTPRLVFQYVLVGIGLVVGYYLGFIVSTYSKEAEILQRHLNDKQSYPQAYWLFTLMAYGIATLLPIFYSPIKHIWIFRLSMFISYVPAILYNHIIRSMRCFFARILRVKIKFHGYFEIYVKPNGKIKVYSPNIKSIRMEIFTQHQNTSNLWH